LHHPRVLEVGVKGWDGKPPKHNQLEIMGVGAQWVGLDAESGVDVDVVCDLHELSKHVPHAGFDGIYCASVLEHLRRPWACAREMAHAVKPGGWAFIETHQSYPYHPYPKDYFRFSLEALGEVFAPDAGWRVIESEYLYPCKVVPVCNEVQAAGWNFVADAWLNVACIAERV
jgi:SAM-dependent methyltransferase